jgi:hypothetical protein
MGESRIERLNFQGSPFPQIVLQKSKVASARIFGEFKSEAINDSYNLSGAVEVAYEFSARR